MLYRTLCMLIAATVYLSECSHMHGGFATWKVLENNVNGTVTIKVSLAMNVYGDFSELRAAFYCFETPSYPTPSIGPISIDIASTQKDKSNNLTTLQGSRILVSSEGASCKLSFSNCCWVEGLFSAVEWSLPVYINLQRRDGKINTSPVALQQPVIKFVAGCPDSIIIPMVDPDGDNVTCRYGNSLKEKGGVSHTYPYFSSDPYFAATSECKISYNGGGYKSKVAIALIIEDHPSRDSQYVLSYSSLQFVIEVIALPNYFCSDKPRFVIPSPIHNQIYSLRVGIQWKSTITISSRFRIVEFGVVGLRNVRRKTPTYRGNNQYQVVVNWTPFQNNTGFNYMCYSAADSRGLFAAQRCLAFYVDGIDPCEVNNGGCSDICSSSGSLVRCSCFYSCWELASDGLRCLPKMETICVGSRKTIRVDNCAFDYFIGLGDYPKAISVECVGKKLSQYYEFEISLDQCGMVTYNDMNERKHKTRVTMWVKSENAESQTPNGQWYTVETICTTEKYFNTSASFVPEDTRTTIIADQQGFADIEITFDFYTDKTYQNTYSPYDYPLVVDVNDDVYFGILAQTTDNDVELFTTSCVAKPEKKNVETYSIVDDGCLRDKTTKRYQTTNPLLNHFSVKASQFQSGLSGITDNTNVVIQCEAIICSSLFGGTRCSQGCTSGTVQRRTHMNVIFRLPSISAKLVANDDNGNDVSRNNRNEETAETNPIFLLESGPFRIAAAEPTMSPELHPNAPTTSNGSSRVLSILLLLRFEGVIYLWLSIGK